MSIRYKFFLTFSALVAMACSLALFGFRGVSEFRGQGCSPV